MRQHVQQRHRCRYSVAVFVHADRAERQRQPGYHEDPDGGSKTIGQRYEMEERNRKEPLL